MSLEEKVKDILMSNIKVFKQKDGIVTLTLDDAVNQVVSLFEEVGKK